MYGLPLAATFLATLVAATLSSNRTVAGASSTVSFVSDSARAEFEAGRFWHAARLLRAEGAADGPPGDKLLLAQAEAGWRNWPAVARLLDGAPWIEAEEGGTGLYLAGRAEEEAERWAAAAGRFVRYLDLAPPASLKHQAALLRAARAYWRSGNRTAALALMDRPTAAVRGMSRLVLDLAREAAASGDMAALAELLARIRDTHVADASWRLRADTEVKAGDSVSAAESFRAIREKYRGSRRAIATIELGRLLLASGDSARARSLLLEGLEEAPLANQGRAAAALLALRDPDRELTLRLARIADQAGYGWPALMGYDRVVAMCARDGVDIPLPMRIERARLMGTVRSRRGAAIEEFRTIRKVTEDPVLGARNLELWAQLRRRQGLPEHASVLRQWLVNEYPRSSQAAEIVYLRARNDEDGGNFDEALRRYAFIAEHAGTHARAGQGRMRSGHIHLSRSQLASAAAAYESYLEDFPNGRRWQEASYWAGRVRLQLGDSAAARARIGRIFAEDPISYYAVIGSDLLGVPYRINLPEGKNTETPPWIEEGLVLIDLLAEAGLDRAVSEEVAVLRDRARAARGDMLSLAEALIERRRTVDGINLGWELHDDGHPWDSRLIRAVFPFPYRGLILRAAAEWGIDPMEMAAITRQESAFSPNIVSHAGAMGLMQIMPPTGAELARAYGPEGFSKAHLAVPEVNLHFGAAFFARMSKRYNGHWPLILSAYNAGPTRANRWRRYPEASDPPRFAERIPFPETRGYIKKVTRNRSLYRALYGSEIEAMGDGEKDRQETGGPLGPAEGAGSPG